MLSEGCGIGDRLWFAIGHHNIGLDDQFFALGGFANHRGYALVEAWTVNGLFLGAHRDKHFDDADASVVNLQQEVKMLI